MKKGQVCLYFFVAALMFVAVFLSGFLSCGAENCFSLLDKAQDETFEGYEGGRYVYVGGAVESSGWFFMRDGATYGELLAAAGELSVTAAPEYISSYSMPVGSRRTVIFDYREGSFVYPSINVNSSFFPLAAEGRIAPDIILTIESFKLFSCFTEMSELKELLGEEIYSQVFYKLHIGENL